MIASLRRVTSGYETRPCRLFAAMALAIALVACTTIDPGDSEPAGPVATAESLSRQGRHEAAADLYQQLALQTGGSERQRYLMLTARQRLLAGTPEVARKIVLRLDQPVAESNRLLWAQVSAEVAIAMGNPASALTALDDAPAVETAADATNILLIRSQALFRLGQPVAATMALLEREIWLDGRTDIAANQRLLWDGYRVWGVQSLAGDATPSDDPTMRGWLALGEIAWTRRTSPTSMRRALTAWQDDYPNHPADRLLVPELMAGLPSVEDFPRQVALLLPLTGRQQQPALAVRDGFLAAHFVADTEIQRPEIRVYDVTVLGALQAYERAIADGATFVVGPLLKENITELAESGIATTTLALNFLPDDVAPIDGLYQFSLSPENEASQVAERATTLGQYRALALAPNNAWGRRVLSSFMDSFKLRGGQLLDYRLYDADSPDFSAGIQQLMLINESRAREQRLTANLGIPLEYEPRRRSDLDLIFLAATEKAGKLIRPQLRFHYAGSVPTYATSAIYQEGSRNNRDLNGIMFPDIPWIIEPDGQSLAVRETLEQYWPTQAKRRSRLYALGFDAYRLIPLLNGDSRWRADELQGMTGTLYIDENGKIMRRLAWARMRGGRPELIEPAPVGASGTDAPINADMSAWPSTSLPNTSRPDARPNE
jgi:outer membrane PBP1 activator LpoA protein